MALLAYILPVVIPVFLTTGLGYLWARRGLGFEHAFVTRLIVNVAAPCLVFSSLVHSPLSGHGLLLMSEATLACLLLFALAGLLLLRLARLPLRTYLPSLMFPNIGNMGLPVCLFAFGQEGLALATLYFTVCCLLQFTVGEGIAARRLRLGGVLRVPFLYAALLAVVCKLAPLPPPLWLTNTTGLVGGMTVPLMLMALGVALAGLKVGHLGQAMVIAAARLALGAAGGFLIAWAFGLHGAMRGVLVLESTMPVAVFNYLFAEIHGNSPQKVAGAVVASTLLSLLSLPLMLALVGAGG
ncbi:membrane transport protein [mine drainage metagenome]|uniref:Membrane transport protein n=1 Tax=mine drainage metagenome TaxID=410659 RepID=A0A1J5QLQ9_9ZZZZ